MSCWFLKIFDKNDINEQNFLIFQVIKAISFI